MMEKKYYALVKQAGEGCDYTIGCGYLYVHIPDAIHIEDAKNKFIEMALDPRNDNSLRYFGEQALRYAKIIEVHAEHEINLDSQYRKLDEIKNFEQRQANEEQEKAEYERLKRKFDN